MDNIKLGEFILKRRKALDLGQKELSDALFVSIPTISKWEKGTRYPDLALLGELAKILKGIMCHVNLIPANPVKENSFKKPDKNKILKFQKLLCDLGVNATIRRTLGADIDASCGQLRAKSMKEKKDKQDKKI